MGLQLRDSVDHAATQVRIGKPPDAGLHIVFQMTSLARSWDCARHGRMRDDPFQEKLRPGMTIEFRGPLRQRLLAHAREEIAAAERAIHNDSHPAILGERQDLFFGLTLEQ